MLDLPLRSERCMVCRVSADEQFAMLKRVGTDPCLGQFLTRVKVIYSEFVHDGIRLVSNGRRLAKIEKVVGWYDVWTGDLPFSKFTLKVVACVDGGFMASPMCS